MARKPAISSEPSVTFWGAARTVTGSMHRVDAAGHSILLDCGLFQGPRSESRRRNSEFPFRPKEIDAIVLSHAHIDHCGNLPNFVRQGYAGPIYCTPATRALSAVMLGDAAKIQEEDANYLNRKRNKGEPKVEPLYDGRDVYHTLTKMVAVDYDDPFDVVKGIEGRFVEAGHLLGSAMVGLRFQGPLGERRITFTGDLGRKGLPILRDPAPVPPGDLIISEATYGGHKHEPVDETAERLGQVVGHTAERGGTVIIPAFSVGRTQTIVYFLHQLIETGRLRALPIFVDSPMSVRATEVFRAHPECYDDEARETLEREPDLFGDKHVTFVEKVHDSIKLNQHEGPGIIISASGMCESGRVLHHLKHHIENPRNTVLIAGYQAEGTLGRRIVERHPEVRILGRPFKLRAEVVVLNGLSSHADHDDLMREFSHLVSSTRQVRLVHADPARAEILAQALRGAGFAEVAVPDRGERVVLI